MMMIDVLFLYLFSIVTTVFCMLTVSGTGPVFSCGFAFIFVLFVLFLFFLFFFFGIFIFCLVLVVDCIGMLCLIAFGMCLKLGRLPLYCAAVSTGLLSKFVFNARLRRALKVREDYSCPTLDM